MRRRRAEAKARFYSCWGRKRNRLITIASIFAVYCVINLAFFVAGVALAVSEKGPFNDHVAEFRQVRAKTSGCRWMWSEWNADGCAIEDDDDDKVCGGKASVNVVWRQVDLLFAPAYDFDSNKTTAELPVCPANRRQFRRCRQLIAYRRLTRLPWTVWSRWCDTTHHSYRWRSFDRLREPIVIDTNNTSDYVERQAKLWCFLSAA